MLDVQKIDKRDYEHPDHIHEVPIQSPDFEIVVVVAAFLVSESHHCDCDTTANHVSQMQSRDAEESRTKKTRSPRVREKRQTLVDEAKPFFDVQQRENQSAQNRNETPGDCGGAVSSFSGSDPHQHGQAARDKDD